MRIGISISESGSESSLKSVFSSVGFVGPDEDNFGLHEKNNTIQKQENRNRTDDFISNGSIGLEKSYATLYSMA